MATNPRMDNFSIRGVRVSNTNPDVKLDMSGIVIGQALELVMDSMRNAGVQHGVVSASNDLKIKVCGNNNGKPWHFSIRDPRLEGSDSEKSDGVIASIELNDGESLMSTNSYEHFFEHKGKRYHHIIDPRTGYPAKTSLSVSVLHTNAAVADAASTAFFIAGPERLVEIVNNMEVSHFMLITEDEKIYISPAMHERIKLLKPGFEIIITGKP